MSDLTLKEFRSKGGKATAAKYSKEERMRWYIKGGQVMKAKYGSEYYKEIGRKGVEAKRQKRLKETKTKAKLDI